MKMFRLIVAAALLSASLLPAPAFAYSKWEFLVEDSGRVLAQIQGMPDQRIPDDLLGRAQAIAIFPNTISAGLGIGGKYGQGIIMVRNKKNGKWSPPAFFTLAGGSIGFQIGGQSSDIVLLIMTRRSISALLEGKFKLGVDAAAAAGPVGRSAEAATDAKVGGILSYSRSKGLFAGVQLEGVVITQHWEGDESLYGKQVSAEEILLGNKVKMPGSAKAVLKVLKRY